MGQVSRGIATPGEEPMTPVSVNPVLFGFLLGVAFTASLALVAFMGRRTVL